jgi:hypothetical protein
LFDQEEDGRRRAIGQLFGKGTLGRPRCSFSTAFSSIACPDGSLASLKVETSMASWISRSNDSSRDQGRNPNMSETRNVLARIHALAFGTAERSRLCERYGIIIVYNVGVVDIPLEILSD